MILFKILKRRWGSSGFDWFEVTLLSIGTCTIILYIVLTLIVGFTK